MAHASLFDKVIGQLCEVAGLPPWEPAPDFHVEVDSAVVGLIHDGERAPDVLQVYVDMGWFDQADLPSRLLMINACASTGADGFFALHPELRTVIYRVTVPLTEHVHGAALPQLLEESVSRARELLQA